jgi:hypothetical protein
MNHQNMRRMLNDERESNIAGHSQHPNRDLAHGGHNNSQMQEQYPMHTDNSGSTVNEKNINLNFYQQARSRTDLKKALGGGSNAHHLPSGLEDDGRGADLMKMDESLQGQARLANSGERSQ